MCEPATITAIGIAATVASTGLAVYSGYQQQQAQNQANNYNRQIEQRNAQVAEMQAADAEARGRVAENEHRLMVTNLIAKNRASAAGSGLLVDDGTFEDVNEDAAGFGELDALAIRSNAAKEAWGYRNQKANSEAQANLFSMRNSNPLIPAAGSLLSGVSATADQLYRYKKIS